MSRDLHQSAWTCRISVLMLDERQLRCVECCGGELNSELACRRCGKQYERAATGAPILMTAEDRQWYRVLLDSENGGRMQASYEARRNENWRRKLRPPEPVYVNPLAPALPAPKPGTHLWIGGAGLDLPAFINLDVAPVAGVDVVANAAHMPFATAYFDSVACLALLEHVPDPDRVVAEIFRVLRPGSEVQVVVFHSVIHTTRTPQIFPDSHVNVSRPCLRVLRTLKSA